MACYRVNLTFYLYLTPKINSCLNMYFVTIGFVMLVTDNSINLKNYPKTNKDIIVSWGDTIDFSQNNTKNILSQVVSFVGLMRTPASF